MIIRLPQLWAWWGRDMLRGPYVWQAVVMINPRPGDTQEGQLIPARYRIELIYYAGEYGVDPRDVSSAWTGVTRLPHIRLWHYPQSD